MDMKRNTSRFGSASALSFPVLGIALLVVSGCESAPVHDLGYRNSALEEAPAAPPPPPRPRPELRTAFDGHWIGEASDPFASGATYRFPSGSTQIQLQLSAGSGRSGDSRITFGEGPAPAPATDGDVGYPLGTSFDPNLPGFGDRSIAPPTEGFAYTLADVSPVSRDVGVAMGPIGSELEIGRSINPDNLLTDGRADYSFFPAEVYESWCALQTSASCDDSVDVEEGSCFLLPSGAPDLPVDCHKASLCSRQLCSCPADGSLPCGANPARSARLNLIFETADTLIGVFNGAVFFNERGFQQPLGVVRFQRADSPNAE